MLRTELTLGVISETLLHRQWEEFVKTSLISGFMQSSHWALFKQRQGLNCVHIAVKNEDALIGGGYFYYPPSHKGAGILVAPEGPLLPLHDEQLAERTLNAILQECEQLSERLGVIAMRVEPRIELKDAAILSHFARSPSDLIPKETLYLDIDRPAEEILAQMKPKGRYNISLAERRGVVVKESTSVADVRTFYRILLQASGRDKFALEPLQYFEALIETMAPHTARMLFAEHEGELLGAMLLIVYGDRATYHYGGISNEKRNVMAGYALQWQAIKIAREIGCKVYDFFGYDQFRSPGHPYALFSQFKSKFGGRPVRFAGGHDHYFLDRLADTVIAALKEVDCQPREPRRSPESVPYDASPSELAGVMPLNAKSIIDMTAPPQAIGWNLSR